MAKIPKTTVSVNGMPIEHVSSLSVKFDDGVDHGDISDISAWTLSTSPHTVIGSGSGVNGFGPPGSCVPIIGIGGLGEPADMPWTANVRCAGGHRASVEVTEYIDGEMVSTCEGCGERMILPRVPGAVPILRLKAFVGTLMGLAVGDEDEDFNFSELLCDFADIKRAIATEDEAVTRAQSLMGIAEKLIKAKLVEQAV